MNEKELKRKIIELKHENNNLKTALHNTNKKIKSIQDRLIICHEEIKNLRLQLGAKHVGPHGKKET